MILNQILSTILKRNVWRSVWRICLWILGLLKGFKQPFMALLSPSWRAESYPHFCNDLGVDKKMDTICFLIFFPLHLSLPCALQFRSYFKLMIARKPIISRKMQICSKKLEIPVHLCGQWYTIL